MTSEPLTPEALDTIEAEGFVITKTTISDGYELWDGIIYQSLAAAKDELPPPVTNPLYSGNCRVAALVPLSVFEPQRAELHRLQAEHQDLVVSRENWCGIAERIENERDELQAELRRLRTENEEQGAVIEQVRQHNAQFEVDHSGHHHSPDSAFTCYGEQSWTTAEARDLGMILAKAPIRAALTGEATEGA